MQFIKKHWSNILFVLLIALLLIPQTRLPLQVFIQRLFSGAPGTISNEKQETLSDYNWSLQTPDGKSVDFSSSAGKVIILNSWATWCPPCLAEMPSLQSLYNDYGKKVDFYFVSTEEAETLRQFMARKNYSFPVYMETTAAPAVLLSSALPTTFVISKTGKIVMKETGAADWNSGKVRKLLEELLTE
jgi:thiol-disulfide isomerase/thioredoxin